MGKKKKKPDVIGAVLNVDDDDLAAEPIAWKGSSCLTKEFDKFTSQEEVAPLFVPKKENTNSNLNHYLRQIVG